MTVSGVYSVSGCRCANAILVTSSALWRPSSASCRLRRSCSAPDCAYLQSKKGAHESTRGAREQADDRDHLGGGSHFRPGPGHQKNCEHGRESQSENRQPEGVVDAKPLIVGRLVGYRIL
jgi:hypothetical protein